MMQEGCFDILEGQACGWARLHSSDGSLHHVELCEDVRHGGSYQYISPSHADEDEDTNDDSNEDEENNNDSINQWTVTHGFFDNDEANGPHERVLYLPLHSCIVVIYCMLMNEQYEGETAMFMVDTTTGKHMPDFPLALSDYYEGVLDGSVHTRLHDSQRQIVERIDGHHSQGKFTGLGRVYRLNDVDTVHVTEGWSRNGFVNGMCLKTDFNKRESQLVVQKCKDEDDEICLCDTHRVVSRDHPLLPTCESKAPTNESQTVEPSCSSNVTASPTSNEPLFDPHWLSLPSQFTWIDVKKALKLCADRSLCSAVVTGHLCSTFVSLWTCVACSTRTGDDIVVCRACRDACHSECGTDANFEANEEVNGYCDCPFLREGGIPEFQCRYSSDVISQQTATNKTLYQLRVDHSIPLFKIDDDDLAERAALVRTRVLELLEGVPMSDDDSEVDGDCVDQS